MSPKIIAGAFQLYVILLLFSSLLDGLFFITGQESLINNLITGQVVEISAGGIWHLASATPGLFTSILSIAAWNFPMYNNVAGIYFKLIVLYPLSLLLLITILQPLIASLFGVLGSLLRIGR